jgi:hypothetical protein
MTTTVMNGKSDNSNGVYCASTINRRPGRRRRTRNQMQVLRQAIYDVVAADNPATVRQVFYRLVSAGHIDKTEAAYNGIVVRMLLDMRLKNELPFESIADNTRWVRKPTMRSSVGEALTHAARAYRRDLWEDQEAHVEIWCEKDALAGVLMEVTYDWGVPLMVSRGFSSASYLYSCAANIRAIGKPTYLYHFGDHDPSGLLVDRSIERRLRQFAPDANITFVRAAVTPEQIAELGLPTRPTKHSAHSRGFKGESVEVDAIPSSTLRQMVSKCIEQHVDQRQMEITRIAEQHERESMQALIDGFNAANGGAK